MINHVLLPKLDGPQMTELARMLLARKLMVEDRRAILSPQVNAPLLQCAILHAQVSLSLADWFARIKDRFVDEMADRNADPSLSRFLDSLADDAARKNMVCQIFLPFPPTRNIDDFSAEGIADAFQGAVEYSGQQLDMGPLFPTEPENGSIVLPQPFFSSVFNQILTGRHSHLHLEARRTGATNETASDAVVHALMETMAASRESGIEILPFHTPDLRNQDFVQSFAYTQMMELGFSYDEMMAALSPWRLID